MLAWMLASLAAQEGGIELNTGPVRFRSVELRAGFLQTGSLDMNVGDALEIVNDGLNPEFRSRVAFEETERLDAFTLGVCWDFNLFRLAVEGFYGDWEGEGTLRYGQTNGPQTTLPVDVEGDAWGAHFTFEWPAFRYETPAFALSLGPVLGANWFHEEFGDVPESPVPVDGHINALVGSLGPRLDAALRFDRLELSAEIEVSALFGQLEGVELRASLGAGLRF
jgi:hypothetical protein